MLLRVEGKVVGNIHPFSRDSKFGGAEMFVEKTKQAKSNIRIAEVGKALAGLAAGLSDENSNVASRSN